MSREQQLIDETLQDFKEEAEREFRGIVKSKIKEIGMLQASIALGQEELAKRRAELKTLTLRQIEIDLNG